MVFTVYGGANILISYYILFYYSILTGLFWLLQTNTMSKEFLQTVQALSEPKEVDRLKLDTLTDEAGYFVKSARIFHNLTYGLSIIVTVLVDGEEMVGFLPKRYANYFTPEQVDLLGSGIHKIRCVGMVYNSPNLKISKI